MHVCVYGWLRAEGVEESCVCVYEWCSWGERTATRHQPLVLLTPSTLLAVLLHGTCMTWPSPPRTPAYACTGLLHGSCVTCPLPPHTCTHTCMHPGACVTCPLPAPTRACILAPLWPAPPPPHTHMHPHMHASGHL